MTEDRLAALGLQGGRWKAWDASEKGAVGGLYILATFLQITDTGWLFARVKPGAAEQEFEVAAAFRGFAPPNESLPRETS